MKKLNLAIITRCPQIDAPTAEEIKIARIRARLSQDDCAYLTYVSVNSWSRWETGKHPMSPLVWEMFKMKSEIVGNPLTKEELAEIERQKRYEIRLAKDLKANEYEDIARACRVRGEPLPFTEEEQAWIRANEFDYILDWEEF